MANKTNFVLHYGNLQLYLPLGIKLTKINKVLKFKQSERMKIYIDFNTGKTTNATNSFEKNFLKLMIDSVYENVWKIYVRLVNNEKDFLKYTIRPIDITHKIFHKNYAAIHEIKPLLTLNKAIYVGFNVLESSKWLMYDFHYNFIKKIDDEMLLNNTDSLTYEIKPEDAYEKIFKHKNLLDFRNVLSGSKFYDNQNKMVAGKMTDEYKGIQINKFVGLKLKMHSMLSDDGKKSNTAKGVKFASKFGESKDTLFNKKVVRNKMKRIQSKNIQLEHTKSTKYHYRVLMVKDLF